MRVFNANFEWERFFREVGAATSRTLLLDYDGTLAPFRVERDEAFVDPVLKPVLTDLFNATHTRVAVISGRAIDDLIPLLGITPLPEIWGSHGWERRLADGIYFGPDLAEAAASALARAGEWVCTQGLDERCERKPASVALHWRGMPADQQQSLAERTEAAWLPLAGEAPVELHSFDGGVELRVPGRDKGYAVRAILEETSQDAAIAYAGDDVTDEDAFRALEGRGLRVLVRPEYRETAADLWLRPPEELRKFLEDWNSAAKEGGLA